MKGWGEAGRRHSRAEVMVVEVAGGLGGKEVWQRRKLGRGGLAQWSPVSRAPL